jgi:uroporphyrinogen decarboxylase
MRFVQGQPLFRPKGSVKKCSGSDNSGTEATGSGCYSNDVMNASFAAAPDRGIKFQSTQDSDIDRVPLSSRERFLRACRVSPVDRPPLWIMRQAGRALPEYRRLKERYTFLQLAQTPELAAEVTLQPVRRFGFDAAIIFSDILVVPEAMGMGYSFRESGGVQMDFRIGSEADVERLVAGEIVEKLQYVVEAIRLVKGDLQSRTALLGFVGSPWTLANFMLDGGSSKEHTRALQLFRENRRLFDKLCEKLTSAIITFLRMQICAGVDAVQIFDTLGGILPGDMFYDGSGKWMERIVRALGKVTPVIVFSKGTRNWGQLAATGADVIGVDQGISLAEAVAELPERLAVQGNLDPELLLGDPEGTAAATRTLIAQMDGRNGWIFNLGHGLPPTTNLECINAIIDSLRQ